MDTSLTTTSVPESSSVPLNNVVATNLSLSVTSAASSKQPSIDQPTTLASAPSPLLCAIQEIISSEATYVQSLCVLHDSFVRRLNAACALDMPIIELEHIEIVFGSIDNIIRLSETLSADLTKLDQSNVFELCEQVSKLFLTYIPFFKTYITYVLKYEEATHLLLNLRESNAEFHKFLAINETCENQSLESFLIMPVQRVPRYVLLLSSVLNMLDAFSSAHQSVSLTLPLVRDVADAINTSMHQCEARRRVVLIARQLGFQSESADSEHESNDSDFQLVVPGRLFVKQGELKKVFNSGTHMKSYDKKMFFLFNDILIYANRHQMQEKRYIFKHVFLVADLQIFDVPDKENGLQNAWTFFTNSGPKQYFTVFADSVESKNEWLSALRQCVNEQVDARKAKNQLVLLTNSARTSVTEIVDESNIVHKMTVSEPMPMNALNTSHNNNDRNISIAPPPLPVLGPPPKVIPSSAIRSKVECLSAAFANLKVTKSMPPPTKKIQFRDDSENQHVAEHSKPLSNELNHKIKHEPGQLHLKTKPPMPPPQFQFRPVLNHVDTNQSHDTIEPKASSDCVTRLTGNVSDMLHKIKSFKQPAVVNSQVANLKSSAIPLPPPSRSRTLALRIQHNAAQRRSILKVPDHDVDHIESPKAHLTPVTKRPSLVLSMFELNKIQTLSSNEQFATKVVPPPPVGPPPLPKQAFESSAQNSISQYVPPPPPGPPPAKYIPPPPPGPPPALPLASTMGALSTTVCQPVVSQTSATDQDRVDCTASVAMFDSSGLDAASHDNTVLKSTTDSFRRRGSVKMEVAKLLNRTFLNPAQLLSARSTLKDAKKTANRRGPPVFVLHTSQKCMQCADMFTLWRHRHTCKSCGKIVCDSCSSNRRVLPNESIAKRLCDECDCYFTSADVNGQCEST